MQQEEEKSEREDKTNSELRVEVAYGELRATFSGEPESVLHSVNSFIGKELPAISIARKLSLSFSASDLAQKFEDYVRITPEGPRVWTGGKKVSDKEAVALQLAAQIIAYDSAIVPTEWLSLNKLQEFTGLNPKTLSSRLSELSKSGCVLKEAREDGPSFKLTTQGASWLSDSLGKRSP